MSLPSTSFIHLLLRCRQLEVLSFSETVDRQTETLGLSCNSGAGADLLWTMNNGAMTARLALNTVATNFSVVNNGRLAG